ncbi:mucin-2 [Takifugu rubripes]|uniref:Si:ch73-290k24.6 n=1 Tax=Takifugu rubripes TaxID=31033 RepID=A0A674NAS6_TAKRU|nr:mucin-2-like [Takifugu rubripes]XP_029695426.1 mucin-2-like [Takifugu rubripes]
MEYHSGGSLPLLGRPRYCPGAKANGGYLCETGHCCGETGCCTYYYELWWFWLLWTILILFSCCCAYRHRRAKLRVQQQQRRQRETSLLAYHGASSYPSSMLDLSFLASLKLPSYEEVAAQPSTPPPPYSSVFTTPRYPQPPQTSDPHLLTQNHGPVLHRRLSDGPSSFSSDNSSSCSCDSCCPSSLCSSSLSAPITYETDTSHATTPSEATPFRLEVKVENISNEKPCGDSDPLPAASLLRDPPSPAMSEVTFPFTSTSPDPRAVPQSVHNCPPSTVHAKVLLQIKSFEDPADGPTKDPGVKVTSVSGPSSPTFSKPDSPTSPLNLDLPRTFYTCNLNPGQVSVPQPNCGRALALIAGSTGRPLPDSIPSDHSPLPDPATLNLSQESVPECNGSVMACIPTITNVPEAPEETTSYTVQDSDLRISNAGLCSEPLAQYPDPVGPHASVVPNPQTTLDSAGNAAVTPDLADIGSAFTSPTSSYYQSPDLGSESVLVQEAPNQGLASCSNLSAGKLGALLVPSQPCQIDTPTPNVQNGCVSGPDRGSFPVADSGLGPLLASVPLFQSSPAITIETESSVVLSAPATLSPPCPPSPPVITSSSLPATILLLDPFSVPHQSSKGGSSSGHASSLSPSPRATQSPPKQTLFSPCVDVFEPEPLSWEDGEEEQAEVEENDEDDEDVGADESQYRHRRLTGDSGIEVCRCQVDDEGEGEECNSRGVHGEREQKESAKPYLHDSVDCPARGQRTREDGHTSTSLPTSEGSDKAVIVTE